MLLLLTSFLAGVLTVLAPCVLPLLPVIIGGSSETGSKREPLILIGSLAVSVIIFTLLLRASTLLIEIPNVFWTYVSGTILILFGIITIFPNIWDKLSFKINNSSKNLLHKSSEKKGWKKPVLLGASLGPVFTSCSPTYALILATVLPVSFIQGTFYIFTYTLGLSLVLLLIAFFGQTVTKKLRLAANPNGIFKKTLGMLFLVVGIGIIMGWDKDIEAFIIDQGYFGVTDFEENLVEQIKSN